MAELVLDEQGRPVPQFLNAAGNDYEEWKGTSGAGRVLIWGPDGSALLTQTNPGHVKVVEAALPTDAATQTTLAAILAKIILAPATAAKQDSLQAAVTGTLKAQLVDCYPISAVPWAIVSTSSANTAAEAKVTAEADKKHYISGFTVALRGADASNDVIIEVKDGSTVIMRDVIGDQAEKGARVHCSLPIPLSCGTSADATLSVGAAGADAITELSMFGFTL